MNTVKLSVCPLRHEHFRLLIRVNTTGHGRVHLAFRQLRNIVDLIIVRIQLIVLTEKRNLKQECC